MTHAPQLFQSLLEALDNAEELPPEVSQALRDLNADDRRWLSEVEAENQRLREFIAERNTTKGADHG